MKKETLIVIPYLAKEAQGRELEYCIEGWRRHFKEPYRIALVGDYHPIAGVGDDIVFINCPRVPEPKDGKWYHPHLDMVHKFKAAYEWLPEYDGFIFSCDDYYAVNDFGLGEVLMPKVNAWAISGNYNSPNGFKRDKARTKDLLTLLGYPTWNWTTHLPVYFEWQKLIDLFDRFDMENKSLVIEDMYFNIHQGTRLPILLDVLSDPFKFGVYTPHPDEEMLRRAFKEKVWITNSPTGWVPALYNMLDEYYFNETKND